MPIFSSKTTKYLLKSTQISSFLESKVLWEPCTNNVNLFNLRKKLSIKPKKASSDNVWNFSSIFRKKKKSIEKSLFDTNSRLKNFWNLKNIQFVINDSLKEEHVSIKKPHCNRNSDSVFDKNLLRFSKENWIFNLLRISWKEAKNAANVSLHSYSFRSPKRSLRYSQ